MKLTEENNWAPWRNLTFIVVLAPSKPNMETSEEKKVCHIRAYLDGGTFVVRTTCVSEKVENNSHHGFWLRLFKRLRQFLCCARQSWVSCSLNDLYKISRLVDHSSCCQYRLNRPLIKAYPTILKGSVVCGKAAVCALYCIWRLSVYLAIFA